MPNGGHHHCAGCQHFDQAARFCRLRNFPVAEPFWTTCRSRNVPLGRPDGPVYAIVCEVKGNAGGYCDIPYFEGIRVEPVPGTMPGDTVIRFTGPDGQLYEFDSAEQYLQFYRDSGLAM